MVPVPFRLPSLVEFGGFVLFATALSTSWYYKVVRTCLTYFQRLNLGFSHASESRFFLLRNEISLLKSQTTALGPSCAQIPKFSSWRETLLDSDSLSPCVQEPVVFRACQPQAVL